MRYLVAKDQKRRNNFVRIERDRLILKTLKGSKFLVSKKIQKFISAYFATLNKNFFSTRIVNRCIISGKSGGVYKFFKMSRMDIKAFFGAGKLYGFKRSSW